ncbi:helix-turn-helix domain-containing protein, partial [Escherichia coli]
MNRSPSTISREVQRNR